ncbi:MAG: hypothetical protein CM1200mP16_15810 [Nitrospina sp.]|nr:MAG: hypothetical protein CM1200mP16_15810 [Nitrospina sp.]
MMSISIVNSSSVGRRYKFFAVLGDVKVHPEHIRSTYEKLILTLKNFNILLK